MKIPGRIAFVIAALLSTAWPADKAKPNVLFIAIDDLNDYISPLDNHPGVKTPHFERLAKRSVTFANAHCAAPACHPSRVAVMTGVHPSRSGIYRNMFGAHGPRWRHESPLLEKAVVLSQHFRDHGYRAVGGGKIFHTLQWTPGDSQNDPAAWDAYRGDPLDPISADWPRPKLIPDAEAGLGPGRPLGGASQLFGAKALELPDEQTGDHLVVDWAIEQMKEQQEKPLFLAVGLFRPHIPWEVPQKWFDQHPIDEVRLPEYRPDDLADAHNHGRRGWHKWVTDNRQWKNLMQGYLASISYVDHQLGRLLDALDASPHRDNTILVLWADHGFHIGEKENWEKFALWDQTTRVPLFIHAPGLSRDGDRTRQPATLTDLYPTLCELAGLPVPAQCDGVSLVPQLKDPEAPRKTLSLTSFQFWGESSPSHAVSDPRYRYIRYANGFEELYDMEKDPNEFTNLAANPEQAERKARLAEGLPKQAAKIRAVPTDSPFHRKRQPDAKAQDISNKPLHIKLTATPDTQAPGGVLLSHGGDHHGFALYVKNNRLHFAVRRNREQTIISSPSPPPGKRFELAAVLKKDVLRLSVDGKVLASGTAGGLIEANPSEGRSIGSDPGTAVGDYTPPFPYAGKVSGVRVN
jgi:arylsulfatase A-like enzyme